MIKRRRDEASRSEAAELQAAQAVAAFLDARGTDPDVSPHRFAPEEDSSNAEFWKAVEGFSVIAEKNSSGIERASVSQVTTAVRNSAQATDARTATFEVRNLAPNAVPGYEITKQISAGGQGVVYQAVQQRTKRLVAIKVLIEGPRSAPAVRRRFEREIELAASLNHPNIVSIFTSGETSAGHQYYVMDYIHGKPLHHYVRDEKLSLRAALRLFTLITNAIQHAHQRGIIHRDLKPSNIIVDTDGVPRILDFGLAKPLTGMSDVELSLSHDVVGTLPYMSPEQARGDIDEVDTRTDVYSLGVILYKLLTGTHPYPVSGPLPTIVRNISELQPVPPRQQWRSGHHGYFALESRRGARDCPIKGELQVIVLKALAKQRERRYQSAGELSRDVENYLANRPISARRDSTLYLLGKALARHKGVVGALVLILGLFGWTGIQSRLQANRLQQERDQKEAALQLVSDVKSWAIEERSKVEQQQTRVALARYQARLAAAHLAQQTGATQLATYFEELTEPRWRHWEWGFLQGAETVTYQGNFSAAAPTALLLHDDVPHWLMQSDRGTLALHSGTRGLVRTVSLDTRAPLNALAGNPSVFACGTADGSIMLFDGTLRRVWRFDSPVRFIGLDHEADRIIAADDTGKVVVLERRDVWHLRQLTLAAPQGFALLETAPAALMVTGGGKVLRWEYHESYAARQVGQVEQHVAAIAASPDGRRVAFGHADGQIALFETQLFEPVFAFQAMQEPVQQLVWSRDNRQLAALGASGTLRAWSVVLPKEKAEPTQNIPPTAPGFPFERNGG